jgi:hypothetical protein
MNVHPTSAVHAFVAAHDSSSQNIGVPKYDYGVAAQKLAAGGPVLVLWQSLPDLVTAALAVDEDTQAAVVDWQALSSALLTLFRTNRSRVLLAEIGPDALRHEGISALLAEAQLAEARLPPSPDRPVKNLGWTLAQVALATSPELQVLSDELSAVSLVATSSTPTTPFAAAAREAKELLSELRDGNLLRTRQEAESALLRGQIIRLKHELDDVESRLRQARIAHAAEMRTLHDQIDAQKHELVRLETLAHQRGVEATALKQQLRNMRGKITQGAQPLRILQRLFTGQPRPAQRRRAKRH